MAPAAGLPSAERTMPRNDSTGTGAAAAMTGDCRRANGARTKSKRMVRPPGKTRAAVIVLPRSSLLPARIPRLMAETVPRLSPHDHAPGVLDQVRQAIDKERSDQ